MMYDAFLQKNKERFASLTSKEKDVLCLVAQGYQSKEIADMTFNSVHTIHTHRKNISQKLSTSNLSDLFQYAKAFNLI